MMATQSDAHYEWHRNAGVPMGQPGCPQDACHDEYEPTVKCGNKAAHGGEPGYHASAAEVRECYAASGRFSGAQHADLAEKGAWHSTGPRADMGHWEVQCPGPQYCVVAALPSVSVEDAVARMQQSMAETEAERRRKEANERYAAWRTIPVGNGDYANYALRLDDAPMPGEGTVVFFRVERPSTGKYAGKTYVKRESGDNLVKMEWTEAGRVLDLIARDPEAAAVLYGRENSRCAICHRKLTDDTTRGPDGLTSLERGIGPKCAKKVAR